MNLVQITKAQKVQEILDLLVLFSIWKPTLEMNSLTKIK